jgi:hypothetical protein
MSTEQTFYSNEKGVRITATRAIFESTTYSMANIASVTKGQEPAKRMPGILISILGIILLVVGIYWGDQWLPITGAIVLVLGILYAYSRKGKYYLKITSASGEFTPVESEDGKYIEKIVVAINEAMIRRG